jgi:tRNA(Ile)-lysidine synthase TilS/MesJ
MQHKNKKIAILYSGGIDSLYATMALAQKYDEVNILHYQFNWLFCRSAINENLNILRSKFPNKIKVKKIDISKKYHQLQGNAFDIIRKTCINKDLETACLYCKVILFTMTIDYCKKNSIGYLADGSNLSQASDWEKPYYYNLFSNYLTKYNIKRVTPAYEACTPSNILNTKKFLKDNFIKRILCSLNFSNDRKKIKSYLLKNGFKLRLSIGNRNEFIQALCLIQFLVNIPKLIIIGIFPKIKKISKLKSTINNFIYYCEKKLL